tara:strand:- start:217 stop:450 length:234 start_codon:yes stop_codon:yes gene_type:complete
MNLKNYIQVKNKIDRIEAVSGAEFQVRYSLEKIVPDLIADGFDTDDIIEYLTIKTYEAVDKFETELKNAEVDEAYVD